MSDIFVLTVEYGNYLSPTRVKEFVAEVDYFKNGKKVECKFLPAIIVKTTSDFELTSEKTQIVSDTCSVQFRPKAIHANKKGFFYKLGGKSIYLTKEQTEDYFETAYEWMLNKEEIIKNYGRV